MNSECENCNAICPMAAMAHQIAAGRMHATNEFIALQKKVESGELVEVVRCKDCIHYDFGVCLKIYSDGGVSQYAWQARNEDDFCSYGERKTDEKELP